MNEMIPIIDKREFKYRYRIEFTKLSCVKKSAWYPKMRNSPVKRLVKFIAKRARIELGYSSNTADTDIVHLLTHGKKF
jgi:hypothetical protein